MALTKNDEVKIQGIVAKALGDIIIPSPEGCALERERMARFEEILGEHDTFINGNGHDGIRVIMERDKGITEANFVKVRADITTLQTFMGDMRGLLRWALGGIGMVIILAIMNLIIPN